MSNPKYILIADDHGVVRYGVMLLVKELFSNVEVFQVGNFLDAIQTVESNQIDLVILDINIPGGNNIQMLEMLEEKQKDIKVLVFSAYDESIYAIRYLQVGAKGYLHKQTSDKEIKFAINRVLNGDKYMSQNVKEILINNSLNNSRVNKNPIRILSNREFEVAQMLISGHGITDISNALCLQMSTVSTYKNRIFEKLDIDNIVQLIDKFRFWNTADLS